MGQTNRKCKRRKNRRKQYFLLTGILFLALLSTGISLWFGFQETAKKDGMIDEEQITHIYNNTQDTGADEPWNLILVNQENLIPDNYNVKLVKVEGGERVDERIYEPLMEMLEAAREQNWGELPKVVSGYRTQEEQQSMYNEKIGQFQSEGYSNSEAVKQAEQWVAVPGYSEHQLGTAVDINGATFDVYLWLQENSYKYGFIFRYPGSKTDITGIAEEVWHYRYVGKEAAKEIYERGICLEEYLWDL
ncbi:M15 family metallopeptidase [Mediterraneibacter agrestimuris]|uniref:M15 family metallopeptidase n=1 Tax=Mediterraneibacter agrestimuris TaxID=2941333 RepID=UPI00203BFA34|nr:M15 family metallopeptidase [Mediterraneibacter agrestimuris]